MKKLMLENLSYNVDNNKEKDTQDIFNTEEDLRIISGSVLDFTVSVTKNMLVGTLIWLCESASGKIFLLNTNYLVSELEERIIRESLFGTYYQFVGSRLSTDILLNKLPVFNTDMEFSIQEPIENNYNDITLKALISKHNRDIIFHMNIELFSSFRCIDNCMLELSFGTDIHSAIFSASKSLESNTEPFVIDNIDSIISMGVVTKNTYAVLFRATRYIDKGVKESVLLLSTFDLGVRFKRSKFKKSTLESYLSDSNEYIGSLFFDCKFINIDKSYTCIKAKNKNNINKLFLLDNGVKEQLMTMIKEY